MAELLPRLTSLVPSQHSSDESYDRDIRELVAYLKEPSTKPSIITASEYLLEVSSFYFEPIQQASCIAC